MKVSEMDGGGSVENVEEPGVVSDEDPEVDTLEIEEYVEALEAIVVQDNEVENAKVAPRKNSIAHDEDDDSEEENILVAQKNPVVAQKNPVVAQMTPVDAPKTRVVAQMTPVVAVVDTKTRVESVLADEESVVADKKIVAAEKDSLVAETKNVGVGVDELSESQVLATSQDLRDIASELSHTDFEIETHVEP